MNRKLVLSIHLFLSLLLGIFIVITCTTGSLLLIEDDVESWLNPVQTKTTPGTVDLSVIQEYANQLNPGFTVDKITFPAEDGLYHVRLSKNGKDSRTVYADPGTGRTFGKVQDERMEPFATIYQLHRYFMLTPLLGKMPAAVIVGILGIALLLILLTGVYLWWPGIRKFALSLRIIRNRGKFQLNMSLHKTVGIITLPFLLVFALTGSLNAFEKLIPGWFGFKAKEVIPATATASKNEDNPLSVDQILEIAKKAYPNSKLISIQLPQKPGQSYQIGLREGFGASSGSNSTVYIEAATGAVLYKTDPNLAINFYNAWRKGLHFATWGGETVKLLSFVIGMMPLVLMVTGLVIWRIKANARKRSKASKLSTSPAT